MRGRREAGLLFRTSSALKTPTWPCSSSAALRRPRNFHESASDGQQRLENDAASASGSPGPSSIPPYPASPSTPLSSSGPAKTLESSANEQARARRREGRSIFSPSTSSASSSSGTSHRLQYNTDPFTALPTSEHYTFPLVTAADLAQSSTRPRAKRMLARDFIHDSLYNPVYGYFSRHAVLLPNGNSNQGIDFGSINAESDFLRLVQARYDDFESGLVDTQERSRNKEDKRRSKARQSSSQGLEEAQRRGRLDRAREAQSEQEYGKHADDVDIMVAKQVWHTPTELFKPYYARAVARYIVERHKNDNEKQESAPLVIYELGAGSGALASDILGYLADFENELYDKIDYRIIEISPRLAKQQRKLLAKHIEGGKCKVNNESILQWNAREERECFVIALEVLDNLAHDVVSYATDSLAPYQALVSIDESGDMHELWEPVSDPLIKRYLDLMSNQSPLRSGDHSRSRSTAWLESMPTFLRKVMTNHFPFYPNLTARTFVPTGSLQLLDTLVRSFPRHKLVISDFDRLPDAVAGINAPVVQTRLDGTMIPVTTYCVHQGFFDIFFPTDFDVLRQMHSQVLGYGNSTQGEIMRHDVFLRKYAETERTMCRDGSNPLLSWYENASWFLS